MFRNASGVRAFSSMAATIVLLAAAGAVAGCGRSTAQPLSPSEPGDAPSTLSISGVVRARHNGRGIVGARVALAVGANAERIATSDEDGRYRLADLAPGDVTVHAVADGFDLESRSVHLVESQSIDFALGRPLPSGPVVRGLAVDAVSSDAVAGARVRVDDGFETTTDRDGAFELTLVAPETVPIVTVSSTSTVERTTRLPVEDEPATLTLIPTSLNLTAFDQMFRSEGGVLRRRTTAPRVVVERRVLRFTSLTDTVFPATAAVISSAEVRMLLDDLLAVLPQLSGDTFRQFSAEDIETSAEDALVDVHRPDAIVVAQYEGLAAGTGFWGHTRWAWDGQGEVRAAIMMLDRDFETSGSPYRRSLRAHEFGHALGYHHVNARLSVMDASARVLPTDFDRHGARIAFMRPPLNRTPDVDPDPIAVRRASRAGLTWTGAH